tara:strand:+ start:127 stop:513 length:387 start_codon:yes stop_codon:yes gene_type:complete
MANKVLCKDVINIVKYYLKEFIILDLDEIETEVKELEEELLYIERREEKYYLFNIHQEVYLMEDFNEFMLDSGYLNKNKTKIRLSILESIYNNKREKFENIFNEIPLSINEKIEKFIHEEYYLSGYFK